MAYIIKNIASNVNDNVWNNIQIIVIERVRNNVWNYMFNNLADIDTNINNVIYSNIIDNIGNKNSYKSIQNNVLKMLKGSI